MYGEVSILFFQGPSRLSFLLALAAEVLGLTSPLSGCVGPAGNMACFRMMQQLGDYCERHSTQDCTCDGLHSSQAVT